jgi:glutathione S-transferase
MTIKIYGHPWSINTRKTLMTLAEKGVEAELVLVMIPTGEHKRPEHVARHPFGKVPVLDHDDFRLYETGAINRYLARTLPGPALLPEDAAGAARVDQWISTADSYFVPHVHPLLVETLFRRFLGGEPNAAVIAAGRENMQPALDVADRALAGTPFLAGAAFTVADIHWMPYLDYLAATGQGEHVARRKHLARWWDAISARPAWQRVARKGPQPYEQGMTADVIETQYRRGA